MIVEEYFKEWWTSKKLPENGFNKTAMLDFAEMYYNEKKKSCQVDTSALEDTLNRFMDFCSKVDDVWAEEFRKWIEDYIESISKTQAAHTSL